MSEHESKLPSMDDILKTDDSDLKPEFDVRKIDAISRRKETIDYAGRLTDPEAVKIAAIALRQARDISEGRLTIDEVEGTQPEHLIIK